MSYILNYPNWKRLFEAEESGETLSDVRSKAVYTGSTASKTSNASALEQFKKVIAQVQGQVTGEIDESKALFRSTKSKSTKTWNTGPKTAKAVNYIKIGDKLINGDSGKPARLEITAEDLVNNTVEASGNGIYALGRALQLKYDEKLQGGNVIIIGLNNPTPDSIIANADTAFQAPVGDFRNAIMFTFVLSNAVVPSASNKSNNVQVAINAASKQSIDPNTYTNVSAMPQIGKAASDTLKNVAPIDATQFVKTIQNKKITSYTTELDGFVKSYVDSFFEPFVNAYAERLKQFFRNKLQANAVDPELFKGLYAYIDEWKAKQIPLKEKYKNEAVAEINSLFEQTVSKPGVARPAASAASKTVKGKEGELGSPSN
jgi:hypothetical protein